MGLKTFKRNRKSTQPEQFTLFVSYAYINMIFIIFHKLYPKNNNRIFVAECKGKLLLGAIK